MEKLVIWSTLSGLLIGALAGEWKATTDVMQKSKKTLSVCQNTLSSQCDIVASTAQLSSYAEKSASVQWRRGFIGSCALALIAPYLLGFKFSHRQSLLLVVLTWVILTTSSGYNDFHMRSPANSAIRDCLLHEVNLLNADGDICSTEYIDTVNQSRKIR